MRLYDTARRAVVPFEPPPTVRMYVCGITPYDSTHLGHAATYLTYDLLIRRLEELGHEVQYVRNVTDVDDSILPKARELGVPYLELAEAEMARFHSDMDALEMRAPDAEPRATESIDLIIELVGQLLESGNAYLTHGTAYFDVSTFPRYGELSHYSDEQMVRLARARGGNPDDPHRRQPLDFVLWQPSLADEPAWRAPFGVGRPGWHIECSAMAMHEHGPTIDLHGGGTDLIFPHHESEIAQSESLTNKPFVTHWLHSAMVNYEGEKMSKSLGNLVFVDELLKHADPRAIRLALMRHHYRHGFEWYHTDIEEGTALLHRLLAAAALPTGPDPRLFAQRVRDAIDDDLDTPRALDALDDLASAILSGGDDPAAHSTLCELGRLLGVDLERPISTGPA
ncbi:MAG: L-cysteine:1D-myo-inositol 2-amino-2-deoxy-alpha-D-glucopyranoside ligase [Actinomycetota bacterium]|nr:L-cysteine:1D-myo-inositol 2-amino-2-deoxy-alpha-D-glucopyranoside ligase [Actinomycetota bacterium]